MCTRNGTTEIIAIAEAAPRPAEMTCNRALLDILRSAGVVIPAKRLERYADDFHGIKQRWLPPNQVTSYDLALEAGQTVIPIAQHADPTFDPSKIRIVHSSSSSPDMIFPGMANRLQAALGIAPGVAEARDIAPGCNGGVDALMMLDSRLRDIARLEAITEPIFGYVICGEAIGSVANEPNSINYLLWGCGGVALVVKFTPNADRRVGLQYSWNISDGQFADWTESIGTGTLPRYLGERPNSVMGENGEHGSKVRDYINHEIAATALPTFLRKCRVDPALPSSWLFGHNPTYDGCKTVGRIAGFQPDRVISVADNRGNTSSTSALLNYYEAHRQGWLKPGDNFIILGYGAGMSAGFIHGIQR